MVTAPASPAVRPRDRIIDAARDLFRKHGVRGTGVDAIVDAADSNKMTLYRHFGSKDELIVACIEKSAAEAEAFWRELEAAHPGNAKAQLKDWIGRAADFVTVDHCNCELIDAAAQLVESNHPARHMVEQIRKAQSRRLAQLCRDAGVAEAELLVDALTLLVEGARVNWRSAGPEGASARFVRAAEMLIAGSEQQRTAEASVSLSGEKPADARRRPAAAAPRQPALSDPR